jgi:hypothetical protein
MAQSLAYIRNRFVSINVMLTTNWGSIGQVSAETEPFCLTFEKRGWLALQPIICLDRPPSKLLAPAAIIKT